MSEFVNMLYKQSLTKNRSRLQHARTSSSKYYLWWSHAISNVNHEYARLIFGSLFCTAGILIFISIFSIGTFFPIGEVLAQEGIQNNSDIQNASDSVRQFNVTIDAIKVNTDHDPLFSGEWVMDAYVNNWWLPLMVGVTDVDDGEIINLTEGNSVLATVPNDQRGEIRIITVGFEDDGLREALPIVSPLLMSSTFPSSVYITQDIVEQLTRFSANDPNGFVAIQFTAADNFGVGEHRLCSVRNIQATDPQNLWESACDFELFLQIEEVT